MPTLLCSLACLSCSSELGRQVRAAVFGPDFLANLGLALLPAPFLLAAAWLVERGLPHGRGRGDEDRGT